MAKLPDDLQRRIDALDFVMGPDGVGYGHERVDLVSRAREDLKRGRISVARYEAIVEDAKRAIEKIQNRS